MDPDILEYRSLQNGCPQGSRLGPLIWNTALDHLMETFTAQTADDLDTRIYAYADDLVITTKGNTKLALETKTKRALAIILEHL